MPSVERNEETITEDFPADLQRLKGASAFRHIQMPSLDQQQIYHQKLTFHNTFPISHSQSQIAQAQQSGEEHTQMNQTYTFHNGHLDHLFEQPQTKSTILFYEF